MTRLAESAVGQTVARGAHGVCYPATSGRLLHRRFFEKNLRMVIIKILKQLNNKKMKLIIQDFLDNILGKLLYDNDVYNEFSLQHELGIYLRNELKKRGNYKVHFERNVDEVFGKGVVKSVKKEMDIYIFNIDKEKEKVKERYAIELKFPRNGQYPEQMYSFVKDIRFMDDVKVKATGTYAVTLVDDEKFYSKKSPLSVSGIYQYFRGNKPINGCIYKPTGKGKGTSYVHIGGKYPIVWNPVLFGGAPYKSYKYYFVEL